MITVSAALDVILELITPLSTETVPLAQAAGRVLAKSATAVRDQPPFAASAMDGYALKAIEADPEAMFKVIGTSAAGHGFAGQIGAGQCVRIFTGAPLPEGADRVIRQEDVSRKGDLISLNRALEPGPYLRPAGTDFRVGDEIAAPRILTPADLALLATMNIAQVTVRRKPSVALISTGDELVMPGEEPGPDQIIASNIFGLNALANAAGGLARMLPIAGDNEAALRTVFDLAEGSDLIVTIGGAAEGDYDLVGPVAAAMGMQQSFYKVAMRPGKRLMAGSMAGVPMIGLPGNPVASMVCGHVFILPAIRALLGLGNAPAPRRKAPLATPLDANGPQEHYMRAIVGSDGIRALTRQDSSLLSVLSQANALLIRPTDDRPRGIGETVEYLPL